MNALSTRVVLDTNVVLSALLFQRGAVARLRHLWQARTITPLVSTATTKELLRVLAYPKFQLGDDERRELLDEYLPFAEVVRPAYHANALIRLPSCRDPSDEMFLEAAQAGNAELLITGDQDLLALNDPYQRRMVFAIVTPAQALARWPS